MRPLSLALAAALAGCDGPQSALSPAGEDAARIAALFWWMAGGAVVVWVLVLGIAIWATHGQQQPAAERSARAFVLGGGVILPTVTLTVLLLFGLRLMPTLVDPGPADGVRVEVSGEQWWWRVRYVLPDGASVELANEVRLPVGRSTRLVLSSPDVIHSFWIPSLGGKMDMIPGRRTFLSLEPTRAGTFRGVCAEFCGASHAFMAFYAVTLAPDAFAAWLAHQATPARPPDTPLAARGHDVFLASGCGACHTVRGTPATGTVGPDLTHVGGRLSLGAGILPNDRAAFADWIARTAELKPGVHMPAFGMLAHADAQALAAWLDGLE